MKVLLIALTAREHAVADALSHSRHRPQIIAVGQNRNPGIAKLAERYFIEDVMNFSRIIRIAKEEAPDFAFIGPDDPIGGGLADALASIGIQSIAPKKSLARIESSKGFARDLLRKYDIDASPQYRTFNENNRKDLSKFFDQLGGEFVVKFDALKGGKGVKVSGEHLRNTEEGIAYAAECIAECGRVVVEEKLIGAEFSLMSFVSGTSVVHMPAVQDHKRAYEGDTGPNTGGMGTYSDADHGLPFLGVHDIARAQEINCTVANALQRECGEPYVGILYGGFMVTGMGVRLIEYNARFGDPEALNVLSILSSDFVEICQAMISGELRENLVTFERKATVCKYITPDCYPERKDRKGEIVSIPTPESGIQVFLGDVTEDESGELRLGGSRAAGIVGVAASIAEAETLAQEFCKRISGPVRFRRDIGTASLINQRIDLMSALR